jgi:RNA polymerase sigma-70 factor, ECF subfamily
MVASKLRAADRIQEQELVALAASRDETAIRAIIKRHNSRLFRIARSVLRDDVEAEDALQEAYVKAFAALSGFRGDSSLRTWLSRIVLNECLQKLRSNRAKPQPSIEFAPAIEAQIILFPQSFPQPTDPERNMAQRELVHLVERAVDALPDEFRLVLVARAVEGMSIEETAELLGLRPETVKTRLFRARALLKKALAEQFDPLLTYAFPFLGRRCEHMADAVVARLRENQ